jgi:peptide/nickel transport system permease protein
VLRLLLRRLPALLPVLFLVSVLTFSLVHLMPGDPAIAVAGESATAAEIEAIRASLGLDRSLVVQYLSYLGDVITGDLGQSLFTRQPVAELVGERLPVTLSLTLGALVIALVVGVTAGTVAGLRRGSLVDRAVVVATTLAVSMPSFWLGLLLLLAFALYNPWLPATGYADLTEGPATWLQHLLLPCLTLSAPLIAEIARQVRGSVGDVFQLDYVRTARAKGFGEGYIVRKHVFKNAAIPVVTVLGLQIGRLLAGSIVVEAVFGLPGLGTLAVQSVVTQDIPVIQGFVLFSAAVVILANLLVDLSYGYFSPKVREA